VRTHRISSRANLTSIQLTKPLYNHLGGGRWPTREEELRATN
jgi:hypothetical protein